MTVQPVAEFPTDLAAMRRGACPTLAQPMRTGDGLLARLRTEDCRLTLAQLRAAAHAAQSFGNGILEVTARGSLQARGIRPDTVAPFEAAIRDAGIMPASGLMVEVPPLSGLDPSEQLDARSFADEIRLAVAAHRPLLVLAPKLAVVVDGGGLTHLGSVAADVRLTAMDGERFLLAAGGDNRTALKIAVVDKGEAVAAVLRVLEAIAAIGPMARGKDLRPEMLGGLFEPGAEMIQVNSSASNSLGVANLTASNPHPIAPLEGETPGRAEGGGTTNPTFIVGLAFPYRQARAQDVIALLDEIEILGVADIRLAPGHRLILTGLHENEARQADEAAGRHGFWTSANEPRAAISLCAGSSGCASAHFETREAAELVAARAVGLLDGSITFHLSACPKGCAHPAPAALTLTGTPSGYALVVNGAASDAPALYIDAKDLGTALERLASRVAGAKETGETARDGLGKLGPAAIAAGLTLDGQ